MGEPRSETETTNQEAKMNTLQYNSLTHEFTTRMPLSDLSGRDKVNLFRALMDDIGITEALHGGHPAADAITIISEKLHDTWKGD